MRNRVPTGVAYDQRRDCFTVPDPDRTGAYAIARGETVREQLQGQLPRNGAHLRDVILVASNGTRASR